MKRLFLFSLCCFAMLLPCKAQQITHSFRNVTLAEALTVIKNEQKNYSLTFVNNDLERLQVTATLKHLSVPEAVEQLCKGLPVKVKDKGNSIYVQYYQPKKVAKMRCPAS